MNDSFRRVVGRKVISRASAQELGAVRHLLVDVERRAVGTLIIGKGKKARLVDWDHLSGFGPDAVMVIDEDSLRAPVTDRERLAVDGKLELVGKRTLSDAGNELGALDDIMFDPATGALESLQVGDREIDASALIGVGSYAVVLSIDQTFG
jgi:uncharacterized protein YrrD